MNFYAGSPLDEFCINTLIPLAWREEEMSREETWKKRLGNLLRSQEEWVVGEKNRRPTFGGLVGGLLELFFFFLPSLPKLGISV